MTRAVWGWGAAISIAIACLSCFYRGPIGGSGRPRPHASRMQPAQPPPTVGPLGTGEIIEMKVRAWADEEYRSRTPRWKDQLKAHLGRVNQLVQYLGMRFVLEEAHHWDRRADANDLPAMLDELERLDPGDGVDWVIGLITPLASATTNIHELGMARLAAKHFVLRSVDDPREAQLYKDQVERYTARKHHKEMIVFLHEWAHTLGLLHSRSEGGIMSAQYDPRASTFFDVELRMLRLAIAAHRGGAAEREALAAFVEATRWDEWDEGERQVLAEVLRNPVVVQGGAGGLKPPILASGDDPLWEEATEAAGAGRWEDAWRNLDPLVDSYPDQAAVQMLACHVGARVPSEKSLAACERAAALRPADPSPLLLLAQIHAKPETRALALDAAAKARARLEAEPGGGQAAHWEHLAIVYQNLSAPTLAEECIGRAPDGEVARKVREWATDVRRWAALPPGALDAAGEADYVELFWKTYEELSPSSLAAARRRIADAEKRFGKVPGLLALRCAVEAYANVKGAAAKKACEAALAAYEESVLAHFHAGRVALARKKRDEAVAHMERVVALDAEVEQAWEALAELYEDDSAKLVDLRLRYRKVFGRTLPY
jgi:tetratricopeptide (TPR) repeat protein